ncbi:MAG: T9SS type A sorting domain-containing protein, partial [Vicingaceae bacterium]
AMEPFISDDENYLFFNNLNSGGTTKLFYATKVNDSTFNYVGELNGTNQLIAPYLDGVADMDSSNNFYWTSTRDYPTDLDNLFYGKFNAGTVTDIGRVRGNFNKNIPGWLVMDHGISYDGQILYYNNARLDQNNCQGPCETELGIAQKMNDSIFSQLPNSTIILQNINDTNYIYYAPCISSDNLELYYTRYPRDSVTLNTLFEICVAVRNTPNATFSVPMVLFSETIVNIIEAPTLTTDKQIMYYHKKVNGIHKIEMRYRENQISIKSIIESSTHLKIYPNPVKEKITIQSDSKIGSIKFYDMHGKLVKAISNNNSLFEIVNIDDLTKGIYIVNVTSSEGFSKLKFIKE